MGLNAVELRKQRKMKILHQIEASGSIDYVHLIGQVSLDTGLKVSTIRTMVEELVMTDKIYIDAGELLWRGKSGN